ncbi:MAG: Ig-like domain-containing protein [Bacteroidia bacterium]|nr:Ig-like domain-containing protein [Bacteroidia bacterium]
MGTTTTKEKLPTFPAYRICEIARIPTIAQSSVKPFYFLLFFLTFSLSLPAEPLENLRSCTADAGSMSPDCANGEFCLIAGQVEISASSNGNAVIPAGYKSLYILTKGSGLAYIDSSSSPIFSVSQAGVYRMHHLVYEDDPSSPDYLDLSSFSPGQDDLNDLISLINSTGVCADLDQAGVYMRVRKCFIFFLIQARDDFLNTLTDQPVMGNIFNNDHLQTGQNYDLNVLGGPFNGSLALNPDGSMVYVPNPGFSGEDEFTYQICDDTYCPARCVQATVYIEVIDTQPTNNPPVANLDAVCIPEGSSIELDVRFNDIDQDGDALLSPTAHSAPSYGSVVYEANGNITYTPNAGFTGYDLFSYQVCDDASPSLCDIGLVTIRVKSSPNTGNPPIPMDDAITMPRNTGRFGQTVIVNDFEPDGDVINYSLDTPPTHGNVVFYSNGDYDYIPNTDYVGPDFFVYNMSDVDGSAKASVIITVHGNGSSFPVEWLDFTAREGDKGVELDWATASELNASHFEVERSMNGGDIFTKIGQLEAAGTSSEVNFYQFQDTDLPFSVRGKLVYRLKQVDLDGAFEYSKSVEIEIEALPGIQIKLFPNPVQDQLNLSWSGDVRLSSISILNLLGEVTYKKEWDLADKSGSEQVDVSQLSPGMYFFYYEGDRESGIRKIQIE